MNIHLFGATTNCGEEFIRFSSLKRTSGNIFSYSHKNTNYKYCNLSENLKINLFNSDSQSILVSFSPIWLFSNYLNFNYKNHINELKGIKGIIACSSSSVITKKYAFNSYDKALVKKLSESEDKLVNLCKKLNISCFIIRPTMIYGSSNSYSDNNIRKIISLLRIMPIIILPKISGLRQPIHCSQLASLFIKYVEIIKNKRGKSIIKKISVGGDETFSYFQMIKKIKNSFPKKDKIKKCLIILVPNTIFYILITPFLLISPKLYESLLRITINLSNFKKSSKLLKTRKEKFPIR